MPLGALRSAAQMVPYEVSIGLILIVRLVSAFGSRRQSLGCSPNPTRNGPGNRSMGNVRVSSQGSFLVVDHRVGSFIGSRAGAQGSWYYPGAKNPGGDCNEQKSHSRA
ncbi:UNVERIFIED_CONTAM: hypothetical protein Scaly_3037500 [Sesamum calycinum]|uniref:Secreted protein n=1 Tax=Sesamum calycinum TaxID=2727403 RepID=A0AAW2K6G7_9LAMI